MNPFDPTEARLGQLLVETPRESGGTHLEFSVEVEFAEGTFDDETGTPFLRISHLQPPGNSWRTMSGQVWGEGGHDTGELDAVMLLFGAPNPVEVVSIKLCDLHDDGTVSADLHLVADFESEAYRDGLDEVEIVLSDVPLVLQPLRISTRLEKQFRGDDRETREAIGDAVELSDYGPLGKVQGGFAFPPSGG